MVLGKTCRYCSRCAMVMVQRAELEAELAHGLSQIAPQATAKHYLGAWHDGKENMAGGTGQGSQAARRDVRARG